MRRSAPILLLLAACGGTPPGPDSDPDLEPILRRMDSDRIETREEAVGELVALGRRMLPEIEWALERGCSLEVSERLREARGFLRGVQALLTFERTTIRCDGCFRWDARLINRHRVPALLVRPLAGSGCNQQFPRVDMEVRWEDGTIVDGRWFEYDRDCRVRPPGKTDLVELAHGETLALFEGVIAPECKVLWFDSWIPQPGRYRARFVYDSTPKEWRAWEAAERGPEHPPEGFDRILHERIVSSWVELVVE